MLRAQAQQALRANLTRRHLGVQVTRHVVGLADVAEDESPHVVVAFAGLHELADRDPQAFLEDVARPGTDAVSADISVVDGRSEERDRLAVAEDRIQDGDVEQLPRCLVGIVGDQHVATDQRQRRILLQHRGRGAGERVDVPGGTGDGLGDHASPLVEDGVGEIAGFAHDRGEGGALQRPRLLVDRGDEALPQHLELDRIECHQLLLSATSEPSVATSTTHPGLITAVVSRSSTIARPTRRWPRPRSARRYTGVSRASAIRSNRTLRTVRGSPLVSPTSTIGSTVSGLAYADKRHVTASTVTSGIVRP